MFLWVSPHPADWPLLPSSFQRQVKDFSDEMGDCLLERELMRTLPGASVVLDLPCHRLGHWPFSASYSANNFPPRVHEAIEKCVSLSLLDFCKAHGDHSQENQVQLVCSQRLLSKHRLQTQMEETKGENACTAGLILSSSQKALWLRFPKTSSEYSSEVAFGTSGCTFIDHPQWQPDKIDLEVEVKYSQISPSIPLSRVEINVW